MLNSKHKQRRAFSLLELIVTTAMLAVLSTACMSIVRTSYRAWSLHEDDHDTRQAGLAVLQHIVRQSRQSRSVLEISSAAVSSGRLSLLDNNGNVLVWEHDATTREVRFGLNTATDVLATGIETLHFVGYTADGFTPATEPGLIYSVECTTTVNIERPSSTDTISASCRAWVRSW